MGAKVKWYRDAWWVVIHHGGKRKKKRVGPTKADQRLAQELAKKIQARIVLGELAVAEETPPRVPFATFAEEWLRREVELPIARGVKGHLAHGTSKVYRIQVEVHLAPYFGDRDLRGIGLREVQGFYDRCLDVGRPRSAKSIEMALNVLRMILSHARGQGLIESNAVQVWKAGRPRRRSSLAARVAPEKVLSGEELSRLLALAEVRYPRYFPPILLLADTGCRFGEAAALRWSDVDLEGGTSVIARSFSSGERLGPPKTGRSRVIELSARLCRVLAQVQPNVHPIPEETLVFPSHAGTFLQGTHFRARVFSELVGEVLGEGRHLSPHCLRHTWASLHLARGTPIKWVQERGGWTTAKVLLDTYGHFMPSEMKGYADALSTAPDGPQTAPAPMSEGAWSKPPRQTLDVSAS